MRFGPGARRRAGCDAKMGPMGPGQPPAKSKGRDVKIRSCTFGFSAGFDPRNYGIWPVEAVYRYKPSAGYGTETPRSDPATYKTRSSTGHKINHDPAMPC